MKKRFHVFVCALLVLVLSLSACACALADGNIDSTSGLPICSSYDFVHYRADYNKYIPVDGICRLYSPTDLQVISKSATVWTQPRTGSTKIATVSHGDILEGVADASGNVNATDGFYPVLYKGQYGYINASYVVLSPLQIVLMESNVPAYCAPTTNAKKVGSLAKLTRYTVLGFYNDYYIISLRQAAAFVPMSVRHYDTGFEELVYCNAGRTGTTVRKTTLRTGPNDDYASIKDVSAGYAFQAFARIGDWYVVSYDTGDDQVLAYLNVYDTQLQ